MYNSGEEKFGPKLNMFVCFCSGEDEGFPVAELSRHTRRTSGWQSPKLCEYPQELGFRFEGEVDLQNLRILVHESKIPSRIEVFVAEATDEDRYQGVTNCPYDRAVFRRLGHVNFCSNEENNFEARELKTVNIRKTCIYLKLIIRKPHSNHVNMFGQVGVVAISPHGHVVRMFRAVGNGNVEYAVGEQEDVPLDEMTPAARDAQIMEDEAAANEAPNPDGLDPQTAKKVRELTLHKARAVQEEDYDLAKALKVQIDQLKSAGIQIADLEIQKKRAVEEEDYDLAKRLKKQIDELRVAASAKPQNPNMGTMMPNAGTMPPQWQSAQQQYGAPSALAHPVVETVPFDEVPAIARGGASSGGPIADDGTPARYRETASSLAAPRSGAVGSSFDERPAVAGGSKNIDDIVAGGGTGGIVAKGPAALSSAAGEQPAEGDGMPDWERRLNKIVIKHSGDQPRAEVLVGPRAQEAKGCVQDFGAYCGAALFSKRWQLREAAVKSIMSRDGFDLLPNASSATEQFLTYAASKAYGLNDSLAAVFFAVCDGLIAILKGELKGAPSLATLSNSFGNLLADLMLKAGDNNNRVRDVAATVLMHIATSSLGPERVSAAALAEPENPSKKPLNHRVTVARIHVVTLLLEEVGLARKDVKTGLTADSIMSRLVLPALQHSHQDVREGAMALIVALHKHAPSITKFFTELKPAQRALVEERIGSEAGNTSPQPKGRAQVTNRDEPEMVSSSFSVEKGGNNAVLDAARKARENNGAKPAGKPAGKAAASNKKQPSDEEVAKTCQFCERFDKRFDEQSFHAHYLRTCPMLCPCPLCGQVTEISNLQNHIVSECDHRALVRQCPLCKEAVKADDLEEHVAAKQCIPASNQYSVCPFCHAKLTPPGDAGWKAHFLKAPGCVNNPRKYDGGNGEEFR